MTSSPFQEFGRAETRETTVNLDLLVKEALGEVQQDINGAILPGKSAHCPICTQTVDAEACAGQSYFNAVKFTRTRARAEIEIGCLEKNKDEWSVH